MRTVSITSNEGALDSASAVLEATATNPEYNRPALRSKQASKRGGAASIRIDDPNPDIELIETDQVAPAGKYEIAVQSDNLQINRRRADSAAAYLEASPQPFNAMSVVGNMSRGPVAGLCCDQTVIGNFTQPIVHAATRWDTSPMCSATSLVESYP